jgi:molybdopterin biosynthesis enzyme
MAALASGNALIVVPEDVTALEAGDAAAVMALEKHQP